MKKHPHNTALIRQNTYYVYETKIGKITITNNGAAITAVHLGVKEDLGEYCRTVLTDRTAFQLNEYLAGKRQFFDIPLEAAGTPFQKLVWKTLQTIPYGETRSYKEIARLIGKPSASRAVGMANHRNPIAIIIPCHRVIGANGSLVGYAAGLSIKERLLALERGILTTSLTTDLTLTKEQIHQFIYQDIKVTALKNSF